VRNALLALAVGAELGVDPIRARHGLASCPPARMRMELWSVNRVTILDDAYNANVASMRAALETLRDLPCAGRRIAVLGDMAELGEHSGPSHREVGGCAARCGLDTLVAVGTWAGETRDGARQAGFKNIHIFSKVPEAAMFLKESLRADDLVLLKASRSSGFERIGALLRADW
jgi:UDP-N-acetylmuramoyl-tripeptide--D-alanyl-D-alanine ligase